MMLLKSFIITCCCMLVHGGSIIGRDLDQKLDTLESNITSMRGRYHQLQRELEDVKMLLHKNCQPCLPNTHLKSETECDCTNLKPRKDCLDFLRNGINKDGLYKLSFGKFKTMTVFCDQTTDGGGWIVFQRRFDGSVEFYDRNWAEYREGFGELDKEHWLGNDNIHELTKSSRNSKQSTLLINLKYKETKQPVFAKYNSFQIADEDAKYRLSVSGFSGNATDGNRLSYNNNMKFTTKDQDNDLYGGNCATYTGKESAPWWSKSCSFVVLNSKFDKMLWFSGGNDYLSFSEMKFRRNL